MSHSHKFRFSERARLLLVVTAHCRTGFSYPVETSNARFGSIGLGAQSVLAKQHSYASDARVAPSHARGARRAELSSARLRMLAAMLPTRSIPAFGALMAQLDELYAAHTKIPTRR